MNLRALALLALLLLLTPSPAGSVDADPKLLLVPVAAGLALLPFIPLMHSSETLDPVGFDAQPYTDEFSSYAAGQKPWALALRGSSQMTEGGRSAAHGGLRLTTANRLGASLDWTGFEKGALRLPRRSDYFNSHLVGNLSESQDQVADWGVGLAALRERDWRWGGSLEMAVEWFPQRPATAHARYQLGVLTDRRAYHDLSLHLGAAWGRLGLGVGYRAFLNPLGNSYGPDFVLRIWL